MDGSTVFICERGPAKRYGVPVRVMAEPNTFEKFKVKIKEKGDNVHDLFDKFMKDYVGE